MPWTRQHTFGVDDRPNGRAWVMEAAEPGPVLLLLHEIFGVTGSIETVADRLCSQGYTVVAPDLFWRMEPGFSVEQPDDASIGQAMRLGTSLDFGLAVDDLVAITEAARGWSTGNGSVGAIGFCLGGTLAYFLAAATGLGGCVAYYGSGIPRAVDRLASIDCPVLLHFGGADQVIPVERLEALQVACNSRAGAELHVYDGAGHAFDSARDDTRNAEAAETAWATTMSFLHQHLPT